MYRCKICNVEFPRIQELARHTRRQHKDKRPMKLKCKYCGQNFNMLVQFDEHVNREHWQEFKMDLVGDL